MDSSHTSFAGQLHRSRRRFAHDADRRCGLAQLSLLETALCPLDAKAVAGGFIHEAKYFYTPRAASDGETARRGTANVKISAPLGLLPNDEYNLWGLLAITFASRDPKPRLMATPHWCLRQLGVLRPGTVKGGSQYATFRESLNRLAHVTYHCDAFCNPVKDTHEYVTFGFLDILLPTNPDSSRAWHLRWNPVFFEFCKATGGKLLFDLDLFRPLDYASRRLFLKLKDRFWRSDSATFDLQHLAVDGLGFSPAIRPCDLKVKIARCMGKLLADRIVVLPDGVSDAKHLFAKKGKGSYAVTFRRGPYFDLSAAASPAPQASPSFRDSPLYDPLKAVGFDDGSIRRIIRSYPARSVERWAEITLIAMEKTPRGFSGFKTSPQAFCMNGIQNAYLPPDWYYAEKKREQKREWEEYRAASAASDAEAAAAYHQDRARAFKQYLDEVVGRQAYEETVRMFQQFRSAALDPISPREAALRDANRHFEPGFQFPDPDEWAMRNTCTQIAHRGES